MKTNLFVYGTLKRGHGNHGRLSSAHFVGEFATRGLLYTDSCLPYAVKDQKLGIKGEIFQVNEAVLASCDSLEGHPYFYKRELVACVPLTETTETPRILAWCYFLNRFDPAGMSLLEDGVWGKRR